MILKSILAIPFPLSHQPNSVEAVLTKITYLSIIETKAKFPHGNDAEEAILVVGSKYFIHTYSLLTFEQLWSRSSSSLHSPNTFQQFTAYANASNESQVFRVSLFNDFSFIFCVCRLCVMEIVLTMSHGWQ